MVVVHNEKAQKKKRQYLRNNATKAEKILWNELKRSRIGYKFRRQHGINNYIIDFYCPKLKVSIESDGEAHDITRQKELDIKKDETLRKLGINIIRVRNKDIIFNTETTVNKIKNYCDRINYQKRN
jgi:very-short-patch-repair endonuclease